jgi:23S rRNA (adenine-N6)-dimethyltransferase
MTTICDDDYVIEIGAGKGHITRELAKICQKVNAFEVDSKLFVQLQKFFENTQNIKLNCCDFLKATLPKRGSYKVFSNIPFSITSDVIRKLTSFSNPPQEAWLIMEKGAAKRFIGNPYDTLASLLLKPFYNTKIIYHFSRQDFHPAPSVDVVLVHISKRTEPEIPFKQHKSYHNFVEKSHKYGIYRQLSKRKITTALRIARLPHIKESSTILYIQWLCLFRCYRQLYGG